MLASLRAASDDRVRQSFLLLQQIQRRESLADPSADELARVEKGMLFVSLYACIEYTLTNAVAEFLAHLQSAPTMPLDYIPELLPVLLNREFSAVIDSSKKNVWLHKANLVATIFSQKQCTIDSAVFPADGVNISSAHFESVWKNFKLPGTALPLGVSHWLLTEIKEHRNAIAHGREKAASIGARFSSSMLETRYRSVQALCAHVIMTFEDYIAKKSFLAAT